jgi:leucyl aminopeptidase
VADVKSTGAGGPGQITATLYLGHFVEMERWAHIDIAGHAVSAKPEGYKPKGNTGPAVRALIQLAMNRS